jgi:hypothetical protein
MVLEKLAIYMKKTEIRPLSLTLFKYQSKIKDLTLRPKTLKLLQRKLLT